MNWKRKDLAEAIHVNSFCHVYGHAMSLVFSQVPKNGSILISTFIWVLKEPHPYKTIFPSFCLARNSIQLTLSLNKLVGSLSLLSLISFSASTSLSIIMDGGLSDEPNIASSWAVLIFSSLLFYIVVFKWVTSETMELSSLSKQDFKTQSGSQLSNWQQQSRESYLNRRKPKASPNVLN